MPTAETDYTIADQALMAEAKYYFAWQSRLVLREAGQRIVEVGCGAGNFTPHLLEREIVIAVDENVACVEQIRGRLGNRRNLETVAADVCSPAFRALARFTPDTCVCLNVLEHIEDDVEALRSMSAVLSGNGAIILIVPAFTCLYGPIDSNLGHYRRYTRRSLQQAAESAGLRVRKAHYMNLPGFAGWWLNARILKREKQSAAQIRFFDRWAVRPVAWLEERIRPPFGQSLFMVLERAGGAIPVNRALR